MEREKRNCVIIIIYCHPRQPVISFKTIFLYSRTYTYQLTGLIKSHTTLENWKGHCSSSSHPICFFFALAIKDMIVIDWFFKTFAILSFIVLSCFEFEWFLEFVASGLLINCQILCFWIWPLLHSFTPLLCMENNTVIFHYASCTSVLTVDAPFFCSPCCLNMHNYHLSSLLLTFNLCLTCDRTILLSS